MPTDFSCNLCKYSTNTKRNYERHLKTKKHLSNVNMYEQQRPHKCPNCNSGFTQKGGLNRHLKTCSDTIIKNKDAVIKDKDSEMTRLRDKIESLERMLEMKDTMLERILEMKDEMLEVKDNCNNRTIDILENENKFHKELVKESSTAVSKSLSAIAYAKKYFPDAKPLIKYTDMKALKTNEKYGIAEMMIYYDKNNTIAEEIGKIILGKYKRDNPKLQSLWNADFARVVYIVVEKEDNNKQWVVDKGGVKVKSLVIDPILDHIKNKVNEFIAETAPKLVAYDKDGKFDFNMNKKYNDELVAAYALIKKIENDVTAKKVINYLSKRLHISEAKKIEGYIEDKK